MNSKEQSKKNADDRKKPVLVGKIVLAVLLTVGVVFGAYWGYDILFFVSTDDAAIDGDHATISSKMLGRIKTLYVGEGDQVNPGQLLIQLDDSDLLAQQAQANASMRLADRNLELSRISRDKAQDDFNRTKSLYDQGATTKESYDHAQKSLDTAVAQEAIAQAQIDSARAQLGVIQTQLLNTKITAPISGTIAKQNYMPGDVVSPGQAIFTMNNLGSVWITANFEETKISRIHTGEKVDINVDAYNGKKLTGKVVQVSAGIVTPPFTLGEFSKTTQRVPVKIELDKFPDYMKLLPGMSVEVKIQIR